MITKRSKKLTTLKTQNTAKNSSDAANTNRHSHSRSHSKSSRPLHKHSNQGESTSSVARLSQISHTVDINKQLADLKAKYRRLKSNYKLALENNQKMIAESLEVRQKLHRLEEEKIGDQIKIKKLMD